MFILKFVNQECWIATWEGDPGRTLVKENAREFKSYELAQKEAEKIIKANPQRKFELVVEPV